MITVAQRELSAQQGGHAVLTVPLVVQQRLIGAVTFERPAARPFEAGTIDSCRTALHLVAPLLEATRLANQSGISRTLRSLSGTDTPATCRARHAAYLLALAAAGWFLTGTAIYEVKAPASLEGSLHRVVVAPRDGFVDSARVAAGDVVTNGQLLATLDVRDLQLERLKLASQGDQLEKKHRELLAGRNRAETAVLSAQLAQAQIALVDERLDRSHLVAPFAGVIIKGDLRHSLAAPVERGEALFEIAPLDSYRVIVQVDERDIAEVSAGLRGRLVLTATVREQLPFTIGKVTPVATAAEGRNSFKVEAKLDAATAALRPGMRGIAKIEIAPRARVWIATHTFTDWLRLRLWPWLP